MYFVVDVQIVEIHWRRKKLLKGMNTGIALWIVYKHTKRSLGSKIIITSMWIGLVVSMNNLIIIIILLYQPSSTLANNLPGLAQTLNLSLNS